MSQALESRALAYRQISSAFVEARLAGSHLNAFPGDLPPSLDDAYAVQSESIQAWPDDVAGWKIGLIPPALQSRFNAARLVGPIFKKSVCFAKALADGEKEIIAMPAFLGGFAAVEAELVLKTAHEIAPGAYGSSTGDTTELIESAHIGVEIASSPLLTINDLGPTSIVSDFGNNAGLIVGPEINDWRSVSMKDIKVFVDIDNERVGQATVDAIPGGPLAAFQFLLENCAARGITLSKGSFISTGAISGVHQTQIGAHSVVSFGEYGAIELTLKKAP